MCVFRGGKKRNEHVIIFYLQAALHLCNNNLFIFIKYYYVPVMFQGYWLVMITYLQHQSEDIEVYEPASWQYVKGATQTIDREYGFGIDSLLYHITRRSCRPSFILHSNSSLSSNRCNRGNSRQNSANTPASTRRNEISTLFSSLFLFHPRLEYLVGHGNGMLKYYKSSEKSG